MFYNTILASLFMFFTCISCYTFTDITDKVFESGSEGYIAAYADFDSNKQTDLFVISNDGKKIYLYLSYRNSQFKSKLLIHDRAHNDTRITSVVPADFDGDSQTDILVTRQQLNHNLMVDIYWGDVDNISVGDKTTIHEKLLDQPLIIDSNGDLIPDIFGEVEGGNRYFWYISSNRTLSRVQLVNGSASQPLPSMRKPQSSAFVDWDGNLTPDLLLVSQVSEDSNKIQIEVWSPQGGSLKWSNTIAGPRIDARHIGILSVADIDQTGLMDLVLPVCMDTDCIHSCIYVFDHTRWIKLPVKFTLARKWGFVPATAGNWNLKLPITLRVGDFNLDGYPDYIVVLRTREKKQTKHQMTFVLVNRECQDRECDLYPRTFAALNDAPITLSHHQALIPTFFDISENGRLDVVMTTYSNKPLIKAFRYKASFDSYFLKIMVISGKCSKSCIHGDRSLGINLPGPTTYYKTVKSNGCPQRSTATQLSQSAYLALQLPYVIYGLGATPNAVDVFKAGVSHSNESSEDLNRTWTYVVPNTQMIIIPTPQDSPAHWKTRLFMTPSQIVLLTAAALSGTFGLIAVVTAALHWREHVVDKRERLQEAQKFHFDAM